MPIVKIVEHIIDTAAGNLGSTQDIRIRKRLLYCVELFRASILQDCNCNFIGEWREKLIWKGMGRE